MSMTREDASDILSDEEISCLIGKFHGAKEALDLALSSLRGPTREMAERMFPGCKMCKPVCHKCKNYPLALYPQACRTCVEHSNYESVSNFCEDCGRPLTDEAVQMVMERLEVLKDGKGV